MNSRIKIYSIVVIICLSFLVVNVPAQSAESLMSTGNSLLSNGAYDQAITKFQKVIARDPSNFEAQFNLAHCYLNSERFSNAVTEFRKAVSIDPSSAEAWSNMAYAYEQLGQSEKALDALYRAVQSNPNNINARINLATVYGQKNRYDQAIAQYKQVLQMDGTNLDAHVNLAKCLISKNKLKDAEHYLNGAIAINPKEAEAYWELGNLQSGKDNDAAIKNYRKALSLKPNSQSYYENLALLCEDLWKKNKDESKKLEALELWKSSLIYLDDALKKEKVQARIDLIERGEAPSGKVTSEELFGSTEASKVDFEALRSEMRTEDKEPTSTQQISVESYDVGSDISTMSEEGGGAFDFDMKKAVEKKKEQKALDEGGTVEEGVKDAKEVKKEDVKEVKKEKKTKEEKKE